MGLLASPLLFFGGPDEFSPRSWSAAWDLGHALLFFALVRGTLAFRPDWPRSSREAVRIAAGAVALTLPTAAAVEWLQGWVGREQSYLDVWISLAGTVLALMYSSMWSALVRGHMVRRLRSVAALAVAVALCVPAVSVRYDEWRAERDFPVLADFTSAFEMSRWDGSAERTLERAVDGAHDGAMHLRLEPGEETAIHLAHFPRDWNGYRTLSMRLALDGDPMTIRCRLNDLEHDRRTPHESSDHYEVPRALVRGWQEVSIDLDSARNGLATRPMEMATINGFTCLFDSASDPRTVELDRVWLVR